MRLGGSEHISLSDVGVKGWEVFCPSFILVAQAMYSFQGQQLLPAFSAQQRMSLHEWETIGWLSSQML